MSIRGVLTAKHQSVNAFVDRHQGVIEVHYAIGGQNPAYLVGAVTCPVTNDRREGTSKEAGA